MSALFLSNLETLFGWLLAASWQASVLALFVLVIQRVLGSRLNPRWRYALWLLVLLRLVLPALPESALSLFQFTPPPPAALTVSVTEPLFISTPSLPSPSVYAEIPEPTQPFSAYSLIAIIWLASAVALSVLTWIVNRRFARQIANSPAIADPELLKLFAEAKAELGIRRAIRLIENGQVQSPAIMGLFQPTLLLPADVHGKFDATDLRLIFLHELAHLKRGDVVVQGLIALLQILHWFNPVLWYAFRRMRIDREPATDALVLSHTGEEEKERYGLMLIKLLEHFNQRHSLPTLVGILEDKDQFKRRFSLIAKFTRGAYGWSLLGVLLLGVLSVACLTKSKAASAITASASQPSTDATGKNPVAMIRMATKIVQFDEDDYQAHRKDIDAAVQKGDAAPLSNLKSFHLLSELAVLTKSGEQGVMETVRVLSYPVAFKKDSGGKFKPTDFKRQNLGVRFVIFPTFADDKINFKGVLNITSLEGWTQTEEDPHKPIFHTRKASVSEPFISGQTKGFEVPGGAQMEPTDPTFYFAPNKLPDASQNPKALRRLFLFLTASGFSADGNALPSPMSAQLNDQKFSQFVEKVNAALHSPDSKKYKDLFFEKDIPETDQVALNARFESLMISLVGNSDWKIKVIPTKEIPPETNTGLNLEAVCGLEIQNAEKDGSHRIILPVCCSFGEYFIAESKTPGPGALMIEAVQKGDTAASAPHVWPPADLNKTIGFTALDATGEINRPTDPAINAVVNSLKLTSLDLPTLPLHHYLDGMAKALKEQNPGSEQISFELMCPAEDQPYPISFHLQHLTSLREIIAQLNAQYPLRYQIRGVTDIAVWQVSHFETDFKKQAAKTTINLNLGHATLAEALKAVQAAAAAKGFVFDISNFGDFRRFPAEAPHNITLQQRQISLDQALSYILTTSKTRLVYELYGAGKRYTIAPAAQDLPMDPMTSEAAGQTPNLNASAKMLTVRTFLIPYGFFETKSNNAAGMKRELIGHGIEFSPDANVSYLPEQNKLVVRNTPEQLDKIATLIETFPDPTAIPETTPASATETPETPKEVTAASSSGAPGAPPAMSSAKADAAVPSSTLVGISGGDGIKTAQEIVNYYAQAPGPAPSPAVVAMSNPVSGQIEVSLKVAEIDDDVYLANKEKVDAAVEKADIGYFNNLKGVSMLSTPKATTKPGLKANIDIVREFPYPTSFENSKIAPGYKGPNGFVQASVGPGGKTNVVLSVPPTPREFVTKDLGVSVEITPTIGAENSAERGKIILNGKLSVADFEGFTKSNLSDANMPSFSTRESLFIEALDNGQEKGVWIPGLRSDDQTDADYTLANGRTLPTAKAGTKRMFVFLSAKLVK